MDFSQVLEALENASLFDLYRLQVGIFSALNNPNTASMRLRDESTWRVSYQCLSFVTEAFVARNRISEDVKALT